MEEGTPGIGRTDSGPGYERAANLRHDVIRVRSQRRANTHCLGVSAVWGALRKNDEEWWDPGQHGALSIPVP